MTYRTAAVAGNTRQSTSRNNRRQRHSSTVAIKRSELGPISNIIVIGILMSMAGLLYLTQITKTSTYSYQLNNLQDQYDDALKLNQSLKIEAARLQSLDTISKSSINDNYVLGTDDVQYLNN